MTKIINIVLIIIQYNINVLYIRIIKEFKEYLRRNILSNPATHNKNKLHNKTLLGAQIICFSIVQFKCTRIVSKMAALVHIHLNLSIGVHDTIFITEHIIIYENVIVNETINTFYVIRGFIFHVSSGCTRNKLKSLKFQLTFNKCSKFHLFSQIIL